MPRNPYFDDSDVPASRPVAPQRPSRPGVPGGPGLPVPGIPVPGIPVPGAPEAVPVPMPAAEPASPGLPAPPAPETPRLPTGEPPAPAPKPEPPKPEPEPEPEPEPPSAPADEEDDLLPRPGATPKRRFRPGRRVKTAAVADDPDVIAAHKAGPSISAAGGRWKVLALRSLVWFILALVAIAGFRNVFFPPVTTVADVVDGVRGKLGLNGFPLEAGAATAESFAGDYLTLNPSDTGRTARLNAYLPPGLQTADAWNSGSGSASQRVVAGPHVAGAPELVDEQCEAKTPCRAVYTLTAQVADPAGKTVRTVALTVPIVAVGREVAVGGKPAFVPAPQTADQDAPIVAVIDEASSESALDAVRVFFKAWATGGSGNQELKRVVPDEGTRAAKTGMGGSVTLVAVQELQVEAVPAGGAPDTPRFAFATVQWKSASGAQFTQGYRLTVYQGPDKLWYVLDIAGGDFGVTAPAS